MSSIYTKGSRIWCRLKGHKQPGKWGGYPTPFRPGEEAEAKRFAEKAQKEIDKRNNAGITSAKTVEDYSKPWLEARKANGIKSVADDRYRIKNHVLPYIGSMRLVDVRAKHIRDMVRTLNRNEDLAPRTVLNIFGVTSTMFRDMIIEELREANPCHPPPPDLPTKVDKDPEWRDAATYTMAEVVALLSDKRIPPERRIQYALKALAGLRHGEVAGLRWRNYDPSLEPLGRLQIARSYNGKRTKTDFTRAAPVHPLLVKFLDVWRTEHWPRIYGYTPERDDLVVPARTMKPVNAHDAVIAFQSDLATLELRQEAGIHRKRGGHDLRAWFITTALEHGANPVMLMTVTHTKRKDVQSGYTRLPWSSICAEVAKLTIVLDGEPLELATDFATRERSVGLRWRKMATPTGFEPVLPA